MKAFILSSIGTRDRRIFEEGNNGNGPLAACIRHVMREYDDITVCIVDDGFVFDKDHSFQKYEEKIKMKTGSKGVKIQLIRNTVEWKRNPLDFIQIFNSFRDAMNECSRMWKSADVFFNFSSGFAQVQTALVFLRLLLYSDAKILQGDEKNDIVEEAVFPYDLADIAHQEEKRRTQILNDIKSSYEDGEFITSDPQLINVIKSIERCAQFDQSVIITGKTGTGKEFCAKKFHEAWKSNSKLGNAAPLVSLNCAAIPESLAESELFGYVKGAFTGCLSQGKMGLFKEANYGVLFLDEFADIPPFIQAKILRAIQENRIRPLGSNTDITVKVRVIAATNKDIPSLLKEGRLREDLYFRLNHGEFAIPPLRDRPKDIPLIADKILKKLRDKYPEKIRCKKFNSEALSELEKYTWPGNVRELQTIVERCVMENPLKETVDADIVRLNLTSTSKQPAFEDVLGEIGKMTPHGFPKFIEMMKKGWCDHITKMIGEEKALTLLGMNKKNLDSYRRQWKSYLQDLHEGDVSEGFVANGKKKNHL
jgi:DNA-binding NtrC family response regulator